MVKSEIVTGKNIIINKPYLQNFYTVKKPNWVKFCEKLLNDNFFVVLYIPNVRTLSRYFLIVKNRKIMKVRYSDHAPILENWVKGDVDLYIGPSIKGLLNEKEAFNVINVYFRK